MDTAFTYAHILYIMYYQTNILMQTNNKQQSTHTHTHNIGKWKEEKETKKVVNGMKVWTCLVCEIEVFCAFSLKPQTIK